MPSVNQWRLLKDIEYQNPYLALSVEEAIAEGVKQGFSPNTLRLWRATNAVVIGRFQCPTSEVNLDYCLKYKTPILRRFTGGGAVYHDSGNLNFAISVILGSPLYESYNLLLRRVEMTLKSALKNLGVSSKFRKMNMYVMKRKLLGMAGLRKEKLSFIHGSLLVESNLKILNQILNPRKDQFKKTKFVCSLREKVTNLKDEVHQKIELQEVENSLIKSFEKNFKCNLNVQDITEKEKEIANILYERKYSTPEWLFITCKMCSANEKLCLDDKTFIIKYLY